MLVAQAKEELQMAVLVVNEVTETRMVALDTVAAVMLIRIVLVTTMRQ